MAKLGDEDLAQKRKGTAGLGVSRNDSPFVFCSVCPMFLDVFRSSLQVCKRQAMRFGNSQRRSNPRTNMRRYLARFTS